jgi:ribosomal protein L16/L10AE
MKRRKFIGIAGAVVCIAAGSGYLLSDKKNFVRSDIKTIDSGTISFKQDEKEILYLASLAPSGHNTQPWFVKYVEPYHWIICNDKTKWLPGVDPTQRETILSIGAFLQNLEYAANSLGYECQFDILANTNQDEKIMELRLQKTSVIVPYNTGQMKLRRTVRSEYLNNVINATEIDFITNGEKDFFHFIANNRKEYNWLNEQTIEANRIQSYRDPAQEELANWIRFSGKDAEKYRDGLTTAGMEINGVPGWIVRNFYDKSDVMKKSFRKQSIDKVKEQVNHSAGWLLITSKDDSVPSLLEAGRRLQRLWLKIRNKNIAIHPMTQVLEESAIVKTVNQSTGITDPVQFVLRTGYIKNYPEPVSLRRPVDWFVRS